MRGLSESAGSWKIIWMLRRNGLSSRRESGARSVPSKRTRRRGLEQAHDRFASVDLPQPDSPTSASVSPGAIVNDTSSTALHDRLTR